MQALAYIVYFVLGLFQLAAIISGIEVWLELHGLVAAVIAMPVAYIPVVGSLLGVYGAVTAWGWSWLTAGGLFFGPLALAFTLAFFQSRE